MSDEILPYLMNRLTGRMNQLWMQKLRDHGLTVARWQVLGVLSRFDGCRIGTIADLAGTEQPATSRVIDQMQRDNLVMRRPAVDDSRAVEVWMTDSGRKLFTKLEPEAHDFVSGLTRNLSKEDIQAMTGHLEQMLSDLQDIK